MTIQAYKRTKKINKQIKVNIERRTVIVDDQLLYFNLYGSYKYFVSQPYPRSKSTT